MSRLADLTSQELAELARERAREAKENDERLGSVLDNLLRTVEEMTRRLDADE